MLKSIYLDHNATTPVHPEVRLKVLEWLDSFGNPSSIHWAGRGPKALLRGARDNVARMLGVEPLEIVFTSGGSEANNLALKGVASGVARLDGNFGERRQIIISAVEHPSVLKAAESLRTEGFEVERIQVNRGGQFDLEQFQASLSEKTLLVSVMLANNETGNIFPLKEIVQLAHEKGALVHTDAVQALGKMPFNLRELGVDLATISGHKFYALKGVGALYVRRGVNINSLIYGGGQERGRRAGTENILSIASLGYMCGLKDQVATETLRLRELRDYLESEIIAQIPGVLITGNEAPRLCSTSSLVLEGVSGETLLMNLDTKGFAVSTGAACSAGSPEPSPTLLAMGLSREQAQSSLRVSLGWFTSKAEVDAFLQTLFEVVRRLRSIESGASHHGV